MLDVKTVRETASDDQDATSSRETAVPGLVLIFTQGRPACSVLPARDGKVVIGRDATEQLAADVRMSRRHAEVRFHDERVTVRDLNSVNGTFADGVDACQRHPRQTTGPEFVRAGNSLFLICRDIKPFEERAVERQPDMIMGPILWQAWKRIIRLARTSDNVFLIGESGTGKELAARAFHDMGRRHRSAMVSVNCGAIARDIAQRLFFGAMEGAYSGAKNSEGYVQAADRGVLFLDEVAELDLHIQAMLLRVLESKQVMPVGASRARPVDFAICAATHKDLREEVAAGRFRQDLFYRIGRPAVRLPPLRERREEIPWLIARVMRDHGPEAEKLSIKVQFVEACLSRRWPGNVRELLTEVDSAITSAITHGDPALLHRHLDATAGDDFAAPATGRRSRPDQTALEDALEREKGNVAATARRLDVHRTQLRRWLAHYNLDARGFR